MNTPEALSGTGETQFGRACRELGIDIICANTPQAKGRVQRANQTLQDRLVKEMRLLGISDITSANAYLPQYLEAHTRRFAVEPASSVDAHRKELPPHQALNLIFSHQQTRIISKQLAVSYQGVTYQIQAKSPCYTMRCASLTVCDNQGEITLLYKGKSLPYKRFDRQNQPSSTLGAKNINRAIDKRLKNHRPKNSHPWKNAYTSNWTHL